MDHGFIAEHLWQTICHLPLFQVGAMTGPIDSHQAAQIMSAVHACILSGEIGCNDLDT